ncbi:MAG: 23S rRNA (adenine(2030)-N(6))-methyltransferase RlmJ, partial [Pseudoxanthomonas sp.]
MNYRHAFHAGNHADVLKHVILLMLIDALRAKPSPFFVLDTHAGRGRYLLGAREGQRTAEATTGILRLAGRKGLPAALKRYLQAVQADNPVDALLAYPGSPLLVAQALREDDRLAACELQPEEAATLKTLFAHEDK